MPKTKDAFALRGFDLKKYLRGKLAECGLGINAIEKLDADINDFDDLQRARKAYIRLDYELKALRQKIIRQGDRFLKYHTALAKDIARLDDDEYYFSIVKPRSKRASILSEEYTKIARQLIEAEDVINRMIHAIDGYQRRYSTKIFATRLRQARKAAGLTQAELADRLGIKRSSYGLYEQGRNEPNISALAILSSELKRSVDWLLGLT